MAITKRSALTGQAENKNKSAGTAAAPSPAKKAPEVQEKKGIWDTLSRHVMTGISNMIPFLIMGGLILAFSQLIPYVILGVDPSMGIVDAMNSGAYEGFKQKDIAVIGVSKDSQTSHQKFAEKYNLPFILVSDPELEAIKAYDVWQEKKLYGKVSLGVVRSTYIIGEDGVIEKVYPKAKPDTNAAEILEYLESVK